MLNKLIIPLTAGIAFLTLVAVDNVHASALSAIQRERDAHAELTAKPQPVKLGKTAGAISAAGEIKKACNDEGMADTPACKRAFRALEGITMVFFGDEEAQRDMKAAPSLRKRH